MKFILPKIYPITDRTLSELTHEEQTVRLIDGGASLIQLRDKTASSRSFYEDALMSVRAAKNTGVRVVINDRIDIALMTGADGVHIGQDDLPPDAARNLLAPDAIVGFSTHSAEQARLAVNRWTLDYIAIGPIFPTDTKYDAETLVGLDILHEARLAVGNVPLIAIGGINSSNLMSVFAAGADSAAVISELYQGYDIAETYRGLTNIATAV